MPSTPHIHRTGNTYLLDFTEENVRIRLDHIRAKQDTIMGEIMVAIMGPGVAPRLHQAKLNLMSTSSRHTLAKHLNTRLELDDWDGLIELACIHVVNSYREGEPPCEVGDMPVSPDIRYQIHPIIFQNEANLIYAPGATGKSYLACFLGMLVQSNLDMCGLRVTQANVLYLDFETSAYEIDQRLKALKAGAGLNSNGNFTYRFCAQALASDLEALQRIVLDKNIGMVVVDSVGSACGGEPESAEVVLRYFMALRTLKITSLSIDHTTKEGKGGPFGSVYKINNSRSVFELRQAQETDAERMSLGLYHRKSNRGKLLKPMAFEFVFFDGGQSLLVERADIKDSPQLAAGMPQQDQIASVLASGGLTPQAIAEETSLNEDSVRRVLVRYKGRRFVKLLDGQWGLAYKGRNGEN